MQRVEDIRQKLIGMYKNEMFTSDGMLELIGESFIADEDTIFGELNENYAEAELKWYRSQSKNVYDIERHYGSVPEIWRIVSDTNGYINSNYGWCIYSLENGNQLKKVYDELSTSEMSRRGSMIYTNPKMHDMAVDNGRNDFMCTHAVDYFIRDNRLNCVVKMRSNDAIFGYKNDRYWQKYVLESLAKLLNVEVGNIIWQASSLHIYPRHFKLLEE